MARTEAGDSGRDGHTFLRIPVPLHGGYGNVRSVPDGSATSPATGREVTGLSAVRPATRASRDPSPRGFLSSQRRIVPRCVRAAVRSARRCGRPDLPATRVPAGRALHVRSSRAPTDRRSRRQQRTDCRRRPTVCGIAPLSAVVRSPPRRVGILADKRSHDPIRDGRRRGLRGRGHRGERRPSA